METLKQYIKIFLQKTFSQNDSRWKNATLGLKGTIGAYGCLMTDATMVANYYGADETPLTLNEKLKANGGYSGGNLFVWGAFAKLFALKYSGQFSNDAALTKAQMDQIKGAIDKGYPVFLQIDTVPATSGLDEHWVLAIGYNGDDFIIQDPWDGGTKRITSWGVTAQKLIYAWCWFEGKVPAQVGDATIEIPVTERDWLVGRATVAKEVAIYLGIGDPDRAPLDTFTKVIAGIKGSVTAVQTELQQTKEKLAISDQEVANRIEQIGRIEEQATADKKYYLAQIDNLNKTYKGLPEALRIAEGRVTALQGQVDDAKKAQGKAQNETAQVKAQLEACQKGQVATMNLIQKILEFLKKWGGK